MDVEGIVQSLSLVIPLNERKMIFDILELFDSVLILSTMKDLLISSGVCQFWRLHICASAKLQEALFRHRATGTQRKLNHKILEWLGPILSIERAGFEPRKLAFQMLQLPLFRPRATDAQAR